MPPCASSFRTSGVLTDEADRESYRLDETAYMSAGLPGAIALPSTTAEVSDLLRLATQHRVAGGPARRRHGASAAAPRGSRAR